MTLYSDMSFYSKYQPTQTTDNRSQKCITVFIWARRRTLFWTI